MTSLPWSGELVNVGFYLVSMNDVIKHIFMFDVA